MICGYFFIKMIKLVYLTNKNIIGLFFILSNNNISLTELN